MRWRKRTVVHPLPDGKSERIRKKSTGSDLNPAHDGGHDGLLGVFTRKHLGRASPSPRLSLMPSLTSELIIALREGFVVAEG
ncbi:hypothetical protein [Thermococcus sp.]